MLPQSTTEERLVDGVIAALQAGFRRQNVPPRYGKERVRRMAVVAGLAVLVCIPAAVLLVARQLTR